MKIQEKSNKVEEIENKILKKKLKFIEKIENFLRVNKVKKSKVIFKGNYLIKSYNKIMVKNTIN